jgi:hypothetical protein
LVVLILLLAWILQEYELPAEKLRLKAQAELHDQIGDSLFIDILPFTVAMSSISDKSQCLWKYDNFVNSSRFCDWYYDTEKFQPHANRCDHHNAVAPFMNVSASELYAGLYAVEYTHHYGSQSCSSCFPPEKVNAIEGLPRIARGADSHTFGLYWTSLPNFKQNKYSFAKVCDASIKSRALNGWCIPSVCPLQTPEVHEVEACRLRTHDPTLDKETKFNTSCLTNKDDCPNCDRLQYKATEARYDFTGMNVDIILLTEYYHALTPYSRQSRHERTVRGDIYQLPAHLRRQLPPSVLQLGLEGESF